MNYERDKLKRIMEKFSGETFHLVQTYRLASAITCEWKYNLPEVMGVIADRNESFLAGDMAHNVLQRSLPHLSKILLNRPTSNQILAAFREPMEQVFESERRQASNLEEIEHYIGVAENRLEGIADELEQKMSSGPLPCRILTEITITNTATRQEGRLDSIFEYNSGRVETIDWKTYGEPKLSRSDSYQTIAYGMLVNYRYGRQEDDFTNNTLVVITPGGIHYPRPTIRAIEKIRAEREYILNVQRGQRVRSRFAYPAVCQSCPYLNGCNYYRSHWDRNHRTRLMWARTFRVLDKRQNTHISKFLASSLPIRQLIEFGIAERGYHIQDIDEDVQTIRLIRNNEICRLDSGTVRVIALEPGIQLLACISCNGKILEIDDDYAIIDIERGNANQLDGFEILLLKTEVDLTKRDLEAIDFVRRQPGRIQDMAFALIGENHEFRPTQ